MAITDWTSEGMDWDELVNSNPYRYMEALRQAFNERMEVIPAPGNDRGDHPFFASPVPPAGSWIGPANIAEVHPMHAMDNIIDYWLGGLGFSDPHGIEFNTITQQWDATQLSGGQPGSGGTVTHNLGYWVDPDTIDEDGAQPWLEPAMLTAVGAAARIRHAEGPNVFMSADWARQIYDILNKLLWIVKTTPGTDADDDEALATDTATQYEGDDTDATLATAKTNAEAEYDADAGSTPPGSDFLPFAYNSIDVNGAGTSFIARLIRRDATIKFPKLPATVSDFKRTLHHYCYFQPVNNQGFDNIEFDDFGEGYANQEWVFVRENTTPNILDEESYSGIANNKPLPPWVATPPNGQDAVRGWKIDGGAARGITVMKYDVVDGFAYVA